MGGLLEQGNFIGKQKPSERTAQRAQIPFDLKLSLFQFDVIPGIDFNRAVGNQHR